MKTAFGEDVDEHGDRKWVVPNGVDRIHDRSAGQSMSVDDRHEFGVDDIYRPNKQVGIFELIGIESFYEFLSGMNDDLCCGR